MWNNIIGHTRQIETLKKTLAEGRLPNAWLFSGIRGIGKRLIAETVAATICCSKKVFSHTHPDLFIIEPEKQRVLIGQIRDLNQKVQYHPLEAKAKVAIIDDADTMTEAAANSLLKTLEEPPSNTHFILISAAAHRILPTIRSRCQKVAFSPLADGEIAKLLMDREGLAADDAERIARVAKGSLGVALQLTPDFIEEVVGRFEALRGKVNASDIITTSESWAGEAEQIPMILDILAGWYRDMLRASVGNAMESRMILERLGEIAKARDSAETTANKQLMFEQLLFSLTN